MIGTINLCFTKYKMVQTRSTKQYFTWFVTKPESSNTLFYLKHITKLTSHERSFLGQESSASNSTTRGLWTKGVPSQYNELAQEVHDLVLEDGDFKSVLEEELIRMLIKDELGMSSAKVYLRKVAPYILDFVVDNIDLSRKQEAFFQGSPDGIQDIKKSIMKLKTFPKSISGFMNFVQDKFEELFEDQLEDYKELRRIEIMASDSWDGESLDSDYY